MNYYIDFDHTVFDTKLLTKEMLKGIAEYMHEKTNKDYGECIDENVKMFNRDNIYEIYELIQYFCNKYELDFVELKNKINNIILNCNKFVFDDVEPFLKKLKKSGNKLYLLTYYENVLEYQMLKVYGSGLVNYFDGVFVTNTKKYELDLVYEEGIFIDDNPKELKGFYDKNAKEVIRIRREEDTYSGIEINNEDIKEYKSLAEIIVV